MSEEMTPPAEAVLETYLADVRRALRDSDVDADEVVQDVRDHVTAAVGIRATATRAEVERVLERLGPPSRWLPEVNGATAEEPAAGVRLAWASVAVLLLTVWGAAVFPWVGPLVLALAWLVARWVDATFSSGGPGLGSWAWLVHPVLWLGAAALTAVLLFLPAPPLFEVAAGAARPWAVALTGMGVWWVGVGLLVARFRGPIAWLLRPATPRRRHGRALSFVGLAALIVGVVGWAA